METTRQEYDSWKYINISTLLQGRKTMAEMKYAIDHPKAETDAMRIGTAVHAAIFEPDTFGEKVVTFSGRRSKTRKSAKKISKWDDFQADNADNTILTDKQMFEVIQVRDSIRKFEPLKTLLASKGRNELSIKWTDEETRLECKGRLDRVCEWNGQTVVLDLKKCQDASKDGFSRTLSDYGYHIRAAWYLDGLAAIQKGERRFFFILCEANPPYLCNWFDAHDDNGLIEEGRKVYRRLLREYKAAKESNVWPGYPISDAPDTISLPKWGFEK